MFSVILLKVDKSKLKVSKRRSGTQEKILCPCFEPSYTTCPRSVSIYSTARCVLEALTSMSLLSFCSTDNQELIYAAVFSKDN